MILKLQNDSAAWKDLLRIIHLYLQDREMVICSGKQTYFWYDSWSRGTPWSIKYPQLEYEISATVLS